MIRLFFSYHILLFMIPFQISLSNIPSVTFLLHNASPIEIP